MFENKLEDQLGVSERPRGGFLRDGRVRRIRGGFNMNAVNQGKRIKQ